MTSTTSAEQIAKQLSDSTASEDELLKRLDSIADLVAQQHKATLEERTRLTLLRDLLPAHADGAATKGYGNTIGTGAAVVDLAVKALEEAKRRQEEANRKIEEKLREQREWFERHHAASSGH